MKILYLLHAPFELPGAIESWAANKGFSQTYVSPYLGEKVRSHGDFNMIVAMGGPQSPLELDKDPYLKDEIVLIRNALKAKIPVLGFCLGAQLIGEALGAKTERSPFKEVGVFPIELTEEGIKDPLFPQESKEFLVSHWHNDMPGLTKEAVILAKSQGCPRQVVRYAPYAYGFQCHPEITKQIAELLIRNCEEDLQIDAKDPLGKKSRFVQSPEKILSHDFYAINQSMHRILDNFISVLSPAVGIS